MEARTRKGGEEGGRREGGRGARLVLKSTVPETANKRTFPCGFIDTLRIEGGEGNKGGRQRERRRKKAPRSGHPDW